MFCFSRLSLALAAAFLLLGSACASDEDREAKARIFSPEEPKPVILAAAEPIDATQLGAQPAIGHRVLTMSAEEAFQRLGPHRLTGTATFEWRQADKRTALSEKRDVKLQSADRFYVLNENDRDRGHEMLQIGKESFLRPKYLPWRQRARETAAALTSRDDNYGLLRSSVAILKDRVALVPDGEEQIAGRLSRRYLLALSKESTKARRFDELPPPVYPEGGPSPDTQLRLDFFLLGTPQSLEGRVWIDGETGVPLKSELWASLSVLTKGADAVLQLKVAHEVSEVGADFGLKAPEKFLPAEDRPNAIAAALDRFGIEAPKADAKAASDKPRGE